MKTKQEESEGNKKENKKQAKYELLLNSLFEEIKVKATLHEVNGTDRVWVGQILYPHPALYFLALDEEGRVMKEQIEAHCEASVRRTYVEGDLAKVAYTAYSRGIEPTNEKREAEFKIPKQD